jgi:membrane protein YqaA with SNARE-associated domain
MKAGDRRNRQRIHSEIMQTGSGNDGAGAMSPWVSRMAGAPGIALALVWGFAESTLFFVVPDVPISLAAALAPRRAWRHIVAAVVGSVLGGLLMFNWAARDAAGARAAVERVPFVTAAMMAKARASYQAHGLGAVFLGPLGGIPYKIYAVEAPAFVSRSAFLWSTAPARGYRFLVVWGFFGLGGSQLRRRLGRTDAQVAARVAIFWLALYCFYWGLIVLR